MLVLCLLGGSFALVSSAVLLAAGPSDNVDWALFLVTVVVLVPAALGAGSRIARTLEAAGGPAAVSAVAARAATGLLAILLVSRVVGALGWSSSAVLVVLIAVWGVALAIAVGRASRGGRSEDALAGGDAARTWIVLAALACVCVLAFLSPSLLQPPKLALSLAIAAALTALHAYSRRSRHRRWMRWLVDAGAVVLVILTVTDVSAYLEYLRPDAKSVVLDEGTYSPELLGYAQRLHQGFWLAPVNDMLHGRALLVDVSSQYGVGVFYFLAAFFQMAPLGYGPLSLLAGFLTALQYASAYGVMRLGGAPGRLAVPAITAAVIGLLLGSLGSPADFPSTGGLRFGLAWLVAALAVLWTRWPRRRRSLQAAAMALVGIASVWSVETFAVVSATFLGVAAFEAAALEPGRRARSFGRNVVAAAGCCVFAHLVLGIGTRAFVGSWPDWSAYLAFLQAYSGGLYVLAVRAWSPGLPVLFLHLASAIALAALLARRHTLVLERRPLLLGIAATSGLGIASFGYFVGHSHANTLLYVCLPAVVQACLWVSLVGDRLLQAPRAPRLIATAAGLWVAVLLAISGWPDATDKWRRTALDHAIPGHGGRIREAVPKLWRSPPGDPRAPEAQALLDRHLRKGEPALVITEPVLSVETLVRSDRVNVLPIGDPEQDSVVPDETYPKVRRAIDRLPPGTLMLTQLGVFDAPAKPPAVRPESRRKLVRLQKVALDRIRARFRLEEVDRSPRGFVIIRLAARRGKWGRSTALLGVRCPRPSAVIPQVSPPPRAAHVQFVSLQPLPQGART